MTGPERPSRLPIQVLSLLASPRHHYFGRVADGPSDAPSPTVPSVEVVAGKGIRGDRYFGGAAHADASVTLMAVEALEQVAAELGLSSLPDPAATRRNVVVRGAPVVALIGTEFSIDCRESGGDLVHFQGRRQAAPCVWMDRMIAPGAHAALRGRGGLRCVPASSGTLVLGPAVLLSPRKLIPADAGRPLTAQEMRDLSRRW